MHIAEDGEEGVFRFRHGIFFLGLTTEDTEITEKRERGTEAMQINYFG
jgi:hypothetical protein